METFVLPPRSQVGYLDPEIAGEGQRVIFSDGETMNWSAPPEKPVIPDMSGIKSIRRYFNRTGHQVWPAWVYHPKDEPRLLKSQDEGSELGIYFRKATADESARYGLKDVWDWSPDCEWRPTPFEHNTKFDPKRIGQGKTYIAAPANPVHAQNEMVRALIPEVAAAVALVMKNAGTAAPGGVAPQEWSEFQEFLAWKKSAQVVTETVNALVSEPDDDEAAEEEEAEEAPNLLTADQERPLWEEEAKRLNIKVDGRWSLDRLKAEVEKASA